MAPTDDISVTPGANTVVEGDNDIAHASTATECAETGDADVNVAKFPATPPGPGEAKKRAEKRAKSAPSGDDATKQAFRVGVPFSGTTLSIGSSASAGGSGVSLTTGGSVLVDATGSLTAQSAGSFTAQTNAMMKLLSEAGTKAHAQAKFEIFAGGGRAPGVCGKGGPAGAGPSKPPAVAAEKWTNVATGIVGGLENLHKAGEVLGQAETTASMIQAFFVGAKAGADLVGLGKNLSEAMEASENSSESSKGKEPQAGAGEEGEEKESEDESGERLEQASESLEATGELAGGIASGDGLELGASAVSAAASIAGAFGLTSKALGGGGGAAPADIEARASGSIKQVANKKISGNAPDGIEWKTATKYTVNAVSAVDFGTTNWGAFAAAKFEVKCGGASELKCRRFEFVGKAMGKVTADGMMTIQAPDSELVAAVTYMTKTLTVKGKTTLHKKLTVKSDSVFYQKLTVENDAEYKDALKVEKIADFKNDVKVNGKFMGHGDLRVKAEVKLG